MSIPPAVSVAAGDATVVSDEPHSPAPSQPAADTPDLPAPDHTVDTPLIEAVSNAELRGVLAHQEDESGDEADYTPDVLDMSHAELRGVLEALLLVATKPMKIERIEKCLPGSDRRYLEGFLRGMSERYAHEERGWDLRRIGGGWQMLTRVQFHPWVRQLDKKELPSRLSKSAMETLAIVAYKQPVSRGKIEDIRGVQCGPMLRQLMDLRLVQVVGRDDEALGRPLLYGTTDAFLERFGISSPDDLPRQHEFGG